MYGADSTYDLVMQYVLLSSLLSEVDRERVCANAWRILKPGGYIVFYDFCMNNPANKKVRKVTQKDLAYLYREGTIEALKVTIAPPIGRSIVNKIPCLYPLLRIMGPICTHRFCLINKPIVVHEKIE